MYLLIDYLPLSTVNFVSVILRVDIKEDIQRIKEEDIQRIKEGIQRIKEDIQRIKNIERLIKILNVKK